MGHHLLRRWSLFLLDAEHAQHQLHNLRTGSLVDFAQSIQVQLEIRTEFPLFVGYFGELSGL